MSNTNKHQSKAHIFSRQSYTGIEQQFPTPALIQTEQRTTILRPAGLPHNFPLHAAGGKSRVIARQPASQSLRRPEAGSTHIRHTQPNADHPQPGFRGVTLVQFDTKPRVSSRPTDKPPQNGAKPQTPECANAGEVHKHTNINPTSEVCAGRPDRGVRQDNARFSSARQASRQPAVVKEFTRSQATNNPVVRSQTVNGARQNLSQVTLWVDPAVKAHLERLALQEGLSVSAAGAAFLKCALQKSVDLEYGALLQPVIEHAIAKQMRSISTRLAWLLVRVSLDSGQTRSLVTNILGRQPGMTTDLLRTVVKQSAVTARGNITRRTPQLEDVIQSVEQWILADEKHDRGQSN